MKLHIKTILLGCALLRGGSSNASPGLCPAPKSADDILSCAIEAAPDSRRAMGRTLEALAQVEASSQLPNPELGVDYLKGQGESEASFALQFPVNGFLIRGARKSAAEAGNVSAQVAGQSARAQIKIETLLKLHRLRQHLREKGLVDEALHTFAKLVKQYESRPQLPPEQEVSLSVFRMAESDYKLQQLSLLQEEAKLRSFFLNTTGIELEAVKKLLPGNIESWPDLKANPDLGSSYGVKIADADVNRTDAELRLAKISSWPELKVGPTLRRSSVAGENLNSWGVTLGISLPIFSFNGGERNLAGRAKANAELNLQLVQKETVQKRAELVSIYQSSVQALKSALSLNLLAKNHERVEKFFTRGIVSSPLVIEAHRSLVDLEKSRNEKELEALESLWSVRAIDGTVFEGAL